MSKTKEGNNSLAGVEMEQKKGQNKMAVNKNIGTFTKSTRESKKSLLGIASELSLLEDEIVAYAIDNEGEIDEKLLRREAELSLKEKEKVDNMIFFLESLKAKSELLKKQAQLLQKKSKATATIIEKIKEKIFFVHLFKKQKVIEGVNRKFRLQKNGGVKSLKIRKGYSEKPEFEIIGNRAIKLHPVTGKETIMIPDKYIEKKEVCIFKKDLIRKDLEKFEKKIQKRIEDENIVKQQKKAEKNNDLEEMQRLELLKKEIYRDELQHEPEISRIRNFVRLKQGSSVRLV